MPFDAVVLSGGRAVRLGGAAKAALVHHGIPLVALAAEAAVDARCIVVVGDGAPGLPRQARVTRESPRFAGPAAALAAGIGELRQLQAEDPERPTPEWVLVLACDMPKVADLVGLLLAAAAGSSLDGVLAVDGTGRTQPLAAVYRRSALDGVVAERDLAGVSMHAAISGLRLGEVAAPDDSTADVDTWADAERLGVAAAPDAIESGIPRERG